jgi:hypothetical protein
MECYRLRLYLIRNRNEMLDKPNTFFLFLSLIQIYFCMHNLYWKSIKKRIENTYRSLLQHTACLEVAEGISKQLIVTSLGKVVYCQWLYEIKLILVKAVLFTQIGQLWNIVKMHTDLNSGSMRKMSLLILVDKITS